MAVIRRKVGVGGDDANWRDAYVYLATVDPLANDYEFEQISDCTINSNWPAWNPGVTDIDLNNHYVKFYCPWNACHQGDPTKGYITYMNGASGKMELYSRNGPAYPTYNNNKWIVENLYIRQTTANDVILLRVCDISAKTSTIYHKNLLIRGFNTLNATGIALIAMENRLYSTKLKIWNLAKGYSAQASGSPGGTIEHFVEYMTIYNCAMGYYRGGTGVADSDRYVLRDVFVSGSNFVGPTDANKTYLYNCASTNGSISASNAPVKSNCLESRVAVDEFQSIDELNAAFLALKQGSIDLSASRNPTGNLAVKQKCKFTPSLVFNPGTCTIGIAGIAPSYCEGLDIAGKAIPGGDGLYAIGCHEQQYV